MARRLATGRTDLIGLIYPFEPTDLGDPVFLDVIAGITERLEEALTEAFPGAEVIVHPDPVERRA